MKNAFKKILKIGVAVFAALCILLVIVACIGGDDEAVVSETKVSDTKETQKDEEEEEEQKEFTQEDIVTVDDVEYSVTNVTKSSGSEYETPKQGCEFVTVSVKIENKGNEKISYNPYDWKMENSQGYEESETFALMNSDTALNSGDLNPGGVKEGTMVFEQPAGDTGLKLNFYGNVFDDEASFKITIE